MYRTSIHRRKYSTTPIVKVEIGDDGKEKEIPVLLSFLKKAEGDALSEKIVKFLNENP
jgi:hypothetical protein